MATTTTPSQQQPPTVELDGVASTSVVQTAPVVATTASGASASEAADGVALKYDDSTAELSRRRLALWMTPKEFESLGSPRTHGESARGSRSSSVSTVANGPTTATTAASKGKAPLKVPPGPSFVQQATGMMPQPKSGKEIGVRRTTTTTDSDGEYSGDDRRCQNCTAAVANAVRAYKAVQKMAPRAHATPAQERERSKLLEAAKAQTELVDSLIQKTTALERRCSGAEADEKRWRKRVEVLEKERDELAAKIDGAESHLEAANRLAADVERLNEANARQLQVVAQWKARYAEATKLTTTFRAQLQRQNGSGETVAEVKKELTTARRAAKMAAQLMAQLASAVANGQKPGRELLSKVYTFKDRHPELAAGIAAEAASATAAVAETVPTTETSRRGDIGLELSESDDNDDDDEEEEGEEMDGLAEQLEQMVSQAGSPETAEEGEQASSLQEIPPISTWQPKPETTRRIARDGGGGARSVIEARVLETERAAPTRLPELKKPVPEMEQKTRRWSGAARRQTAQKPVPEMEQTSRRWSGRRGKEENAASSTRNDAKMPTRIFTKTAREARSSSSSSSSSPSPSPSRSKGMTAVTKTVSPHKVAQQWHRAKDVAPPPADLQPIMAPATTRSESTAQAVKHTSIHGRKMATVRERQSQMMSQLPERIAALKRETMAATLGAGDRPEPKRTTTTKKDAEGENRSTVATVDEVAQDLRLSSSSASSSSSSASSSSSESEPEPDAEEGGAQKKKQAPTRMRLRSTASASSEGKRRSASPRKSQHPAPTKSRLEKEDLHPVPAAEPVGPETAAGGRVRTRMRPTCPPTKTTVQEKDARVNKVVPERQQQQQKKNHEGDDEEEEEEDVLSLLQQQSTKQRTARVASRTDAPKEKAAEEDNAPREGLDTVDSSSAAPPTIVEEPVAQGLEQLPRLDPLVVEERSPQRRKQPESAAQEVAVVSVPLDPPAVKERSPQRRKQLEPAVQEVAVASTSLDLPAVKERSPQRRKQPEPAAQEVAVAPMDDTMEEDHGAGLQILEEDGDDEPETLILAPIDDPEETEVPKQEPKKQSTSAPPKTADLNEQQQQQREDDGEPVTGGKRRVGRPRIIRPVATPTPIQSRSKTTVEDSQRRSTRNTSRAADTPPIPKRTRGSSIGSETTTTPATTGAPSIATTASVAATTSNATLAKTATAGTKPAPRYTRAPPSSSTVTTTATAAVKPIVPPRTTRSTTTTTTSSAPAPAKNVAPGKRLAQAAAFRSLWTRVLEGRESVAALLARAERDGQLDELRSPSSATDELARVAVRALQTSPAADLWRPLVGLRAGGHAPRVVLATPEKRWLELLDRIVQILQQQQQQQEEEDGRLEGAIAIRLISELSSPTAPVQTMATLARCLAAVLKRNPAASEPTVLLRRVLMLVIRERDMNACVQTISFLSHEQTVATRVRWLFVPDEGESPEDYETSEARRLLARIHLRDSAVRRVLDANFAHDRQATSAIAEQAAIRGGEDEEAKEAEDGVHRAIDRIEKDELDDADMATSSAWILAWVRGSPAGKSRARLLESVVVPRLLRTDEDDEADRREPDGEEDAPPQKRFQLFADEVETPPAKKRPRLERSSEATKYIARRWRCAEATLPRALAEQRGGERRALAEAIARHVERLRNWALAEREDGDRNELREEARRLCQILETTVTRQPLVID